MGLLDLAKKVFPSPKVAPKRYLAALGTAIYFGLKAYTGFTETTADDQIPEHFKNLVFLLSQDDVSEVNPETH